MIDQWDELAFCLSWLVPISIVFVFLIVKIIKDLWS